MSLMQLYRISALLLHCVSGNKVAYTRILRVDSKWRWTTPRLHSTRRAAAARLSLAMYMATFRANDTLIDRRHGPCLAHRPADPSAPEGLFRAAKRPKNHAAPPSLLRCAWTAKRCPSARSPRAWTAAGDRNMPNPTIPNRPASSRCAPIAETARTAKPG